MAAIHKLATVAVVCALFAGAFAEDLKIKVEVSRCNLFLQLDTLPEVELGDCLCRFRSTCPRTAP